MDTFNNGGTHKAAFRLYIYILKQACGSGGKGKIPEEEILRCTRIQKGIHGHLGDTGQCEY